MSTVDMPPSSSSWRHVSSASSKLSSLKGFINHSVSSTNVTRSISRAVNATGAIDERRQSWRAWATQKFRGRNPHRGSPNEVLTLFPGWAARRYTINEGSTATYPGDSPVPFHVDVFVSGYAVSRRSKEQATRSQRAFLRLAKGFAALPRIVDQNSQTDIASTDESLDKVDIPKVSEEFRVLDQQFQSMSLDGSESEDETESDSSLMTPHPSSFPSTCLPSQIDTPAGVLQKLHYNLESRLRLFWTSILPSRTVRLHLFASPRSSSGNHSVNDLNVFEHEPLASQDVETNVDGSFNARFCINWEDLCRHPSGVHIAYCEPLEEHDLTIVAELLPPPLSSSASTSTSSHNLSPASRSQSQNHSPHHSHSHSHSHSHNHHPHLHNILTALPSLPTLPSLHLSPSHPSLSRFLTPTRTTYTRVTTPVTHTPIRVISDIDDTVKYSGVTEGARAAFHNVFVKELKDGVIPGMGEWYTSMWDKGARFHYVSNGPFEYLSLLYEFFGISRLPPGSIKLKSYAGRSLFSGLLSTPAERKRAGVIDILESLPSSKFILIGDSGEQDLELYTELAKERPEQIIAVFIRDAEEALYDPIDDPTGWSVFEANTQHQSPDGNTGGLAASSTMVAGRDDLVPPRFGKAKRAFSDTFASVRASVSRKSPDRLLREEPLEDEPIDTPKPQSFPTFTFSPPTPDPPVTSSPSSISSSMSSTSSRSSPAAANLSPTYITKPPAPVPPLSIPSPGSASHSDASAGPKNVTISSRNTSQSEKLRPQQHGPPTSTPKLPPSSSDVLPPAPSTYYKPESNSRHASFSGSRRGRYGSLGIGYERGSTWSSSASSVGSSGGGSSGKMSEGEKKRQDLQMRVYRARTQMPGGVRLRVFRDPSECAEDVNLLLPATGWSKPRHQV